MKNIRISKIKFLILMVLSASHLNSQTNIVPNSSFELGSQSPMGQNQFNFCDNWETLQSGSADWYDNSTFAGILGLPTSISCSVESGGGTIQAHSGTRYAGFGSCEGVYVELESDLSLCSTFRVSFWYSPRCYGQDLEFSAYLLQEDINDVTFDDCNNPMDGLDAYKFTASINSVVGAPAKQFNEPGTWYYYESDLVTVAEEDVTLTGIFIKGREDPPSGTGAFGDGDYIYLDDVAISVIDICDNECVSESPLSITEITRDEEINYYQDLVIEGDPFAVVANERPFSNLRLNNAVYYEFRVFGYWGGLVHEETKNICTDWYFPCWNGHETGESTLTLPGSTNESTYYTFTLEAFGCGKDKSIVLSGPIALLYDNFGTGDEVMDACDGEGFANPTPTTPDVYCCPRIEKIVDYSLATGGSAIDFVQASEQVILQGGSIFSETVNEERVTVQAGQNITITDTKVLRTFNPNKVAIFRIAECEIEKSRSPGKRNYRPVNKKVDALLVEQGKPNNDLLNVYPNPSTGKVNIEINSYIDKITIFNYLGLELQDIPIELNYSSEEKSQVIADFTELPKGVYFISIHSGKEIISQKVTIVVP